MPFQTGHSGLLISEMFEIREMKTLEEKLGPKKYGQIEGETFDPCKTCENPVDLW